MSNRLHGRRLAAVSLAAVLSAALAACGSSSPNSVSGASLSPAAATGPATTTIQVAQNTGPGGTPATITVKQQPSIRAELPADVRSSGQLTVAVGALPSSFPPIAYLAQDNKTLIGTDPDLARAVAAVLGLTPTFANYTWDNMFLAIDSGKADAGFANITDTEQRKEKYDFACYRQDNLGFAVKSSNPWNFDGDYEKLAGLTVAVDSGTNQEKILEAWQSKLQGEGKSLTIKRFADSTSTWTALQSGQIDAYFTPNPSVAYQVETTKGTPQAVRDAGTFSGAGATLQGLICATSKKGDGLAKPISDAINYLIQHGQYATIIKAYSDESDAVKSSSVNPPGLPLDNQ